MYDLQNSKNCIFCYEGKAFCTLEVSIFAAVPIVPGLQKKHHQYNCEVFSDYSQVPLAHA